VEPGALEPLPNLLKTIALGHPRTGPPPYLGLTGS
jgi:hypothetical protein